MEELLSLFKQINDTLEKQLHCLEHFETLLDTEEQALASYDLPYFERSLVLKSHQTTIAQGLEERRAALMQRLCHLIACDTRNHTLSLSFFSTAFARYLNNLQSVRIDEDIMQLLHKVFKQFTEVAAELVSLLQGLQPRIYRNQTLLKKLQKNINLSIKLLQTEADNGAQYDALGHSMQSRGTHTSSLLIRA